MTSQRAAAMAAFQEKASEASSEEPKASGEVSAREIAMRNLGRKGVVTSAPGKGVAGALKNLGIEETSQKVVPNWKMTAAQKNAAAARAEIKGSGGASSARSVFSSREADTITSPSPSFRAAGLAAGLAAPVSSASRPSTVKSTAAPTVVSGACASAAAGAAEAADMVDHDLNLLVAGLKRLGTTEADGSVVAPFGKIVDDEILEQQLESLVGTLNAGRRRGILDWKGQMLLKGLHDAEPIKLLAPASGASATPSAPAAPCDSVAPDAPVASVEPEATVDTAATPPVPVSDPPPTTADQTPTEVS